MTFFPLSLEAAVFTVAVKEKPNRLDSYKMVKNISGATTLLCGSNWKSKKGKRKEGDRVITYWEKHISHCSKTGKLGRGMSLGWNKYLSKGLHENNGPTHASIKYRRRCKPSKGHPTILCPSHKCEPRPLLWREKELVNFKTKLIKKKAHLS